MVYRYAHGDESSLDFIIITNIGLCNPSFLLRYAHGDESSLDFMGRVRYPPRLCEPPTKDEEGAYTGGTWNRTASSEDRFAPMWFPLRRSNEHLMTVNRYLTGDEFAGKKTPYTRDVQGDGCILVFFEVVSTEEENKLLEDTDYPEPHPWPPLKECTFQMILLGCVMKHKAFKIYIILRL